MIPVDITMLAWPGWRGLLARKRWEARYGSEDLKYFQQRAETRHAAWVERGCILSLVRSVRDPRDPYHTYVNAVCREHDLHVDDKGVCPRC